MAADSRLAVDSRLVVRSLRVPHSHLEALSPLAVASHLAACSRPVVHSPRVVVSPHLSLPTRYLLEYLASVAQRLKHTCYISASFYLSYKFPDCRSLSLATCSVYNIYIIYPQRMPRIKVLEAFLPQSSLIFSTTKILFQRLLKCTV